MNIRHVKNLVVLDFNELPLSSFASRLIPITRIMPAGPYEGQVPVREYEEDPAHEGRIQPNEITVTGH